jgi:uncharacterized YigZ family protein
MNDTFLTLKFESEGMYKEKGSKFLSFAFPVVNEEEVKEKLDYLKKKYHDARHHCYAYRIGYDQNRFRANDDGEPNHSAGDPILGQIRSHELTNVLIVVVRYFGGTKLGVGGLIQAYRTAALQAIATNEIITGIIREKMVIQFEYPVMNEVMKMIKEEDLEILDQKFDDSCEIKLQVRVAILPEVMERMQTIRNLKVLND